MLIENRGSVLVALVSSQGFVPLVRQPDKAHRPPVYWKLPGGKIEEGETPRQAALREALEELGIDISSCNLGQPIEFDQVGPSGPYVQHLFVGVISDEQLSGHINKKVVERIDDEGERSESTCFHLNELDRMVDFMPKHRKFIESLRQTA